MGYKVERRLTSIGNLSALVATEALPLLTGSQSDKLHTLVKNLVMSV